MDKPDTGEIGEIEALRTLGQLLPKRIQILWTRLERPNHPFDLLLLDNGQIAGCIEVKTMARVRKWYWTQFKRPAIRRKLAYARRVDCQKIWTIVVRLDKKPDIRCLTGLPSTYFEAFDPDLSQIAKNL
jgi:hypothetical protein